MALSAEFLKLLFSKIFLKFSSNACFKICNGHFKRKVQFVALEQYFWNFVTVFTSYQCNLVVFSFKIRNRKMKVDKILIVLFITLINYVFCDKPASKYSKKANIPEENNYGSDFRNLQKPFRMAKLNLVWSKAAHVSYSFPHNYCYQVTKSDSNFISLQNFQGDQFPIIFVPIKL